MVKKQIQLAPATISAQQAIPLLQKQIEKGEQLLSTKSINRFNQQEFDNNTYKGWEQTCLAILQKTFGERSSNWDAFFIAHPPSHIMREQEKYDYAFEKLKCKITSLKSSLEQLSMNLEPTEMIGMPIDITNLNIIDSIISNSDILDVIRRDRLELSIALYYNQHKCVLLLSGSILEGILIDILDRNKGKVGSLMPQRKNFPEDASLSFLLKAAANYSLFTPTTVALAGTITDHRDLIHPHAEVRGRIIVDKTTAEAIVFLLKSVARDLVEANDNGIINAYINT